MISWQEFKNKWNGKPCEMGGSANALDQCVDLANAWISEGYGEPMVFGTNAVDFPKKISSNFTFIKNTNEGVPSQGDLVIYKSPDGIGHIDIFDNGDTNIFYSFSQNWPVGAKCQMVKHIYIGTYSVVGWLHYNKPVISPPIENKDETRALDILKQFKIDTNQGNLEGSAAALVGAYRDLIEKNKNIKILETKQVELQTKISQNQITIDSCQSELDSANKKLAEFDALTGIELVLTGIRKLLIKKQL